MTDSNFNLVNNEFVLCTANLTIKDNMMIFGFSVIDSYQKKVKITEFVENDFFSNIENILIHEAPSHENTKFYVLGNFPLEFHSQKFTNILEKIELIDGKQVKTNLKEFENKNFDFMSAIKLLIKEDNYEKSSIIKENDMILALNTLTGTINYIRLLQYELFQNQFELEKYNTKEFMNLDMTCVKCLNLIENLEDKKTIHSNMFAKSQKCANNTNSKSSVFSILNSCVTKFGTRMLRSWLLQPLQDPEQINIRLNIVELFVSSMSFKNEVKSYLSKIDDIQTVNMSLAKYISKNDENLVKISDLAKMQTSLGVCKSLLAYLKCYEGVNQELFFERYVNNAEKILTLLSKLDEILIKTIVYDNNLREYALNSNLNTEMSEIKDRIDQNWKELEDIRDEIEQEVNKNVNKARKVKIEEYQVQGYCYTIPKETGEKYIKNHSNFKIVNTNKVNMIINNKHSVEISSTIKSLRTDYKNIEKTYYKKIVDVSSTYQPLIGKLIYLLSELDVLTSFGSMVLNSKETYCKPLILENKRKLVLKDSRHLILEWNEDIVKKNNPNNKNLIANDCDMAEDSNIMLLTGINMGGKSTYLRQVGICVLLAHIGSFVPATEAEMPIIDQIFTRVGAGDLMLKGISTYMNEMIEVCSLIKAASKNSLMLIDELGRGTSTDDGIGISYAILHYISTNINSLCIFATHFFEITVLEKILKNVKNFYVSYSLNKGEMIMDYKILKGFSNNSFGVNLFKTMKFDEDTCKALEQFID